ncbi:MAG: enoyl-CoA hydratase/isomerase family protein [Candidatus Acidiferrales bacterium]
MNPSDQMFDSNSCCVGVTIEGRVASVLLDRPPLNVMNIRMMDSLHTLITKIVDRADILILRGAGKSAFSAGAEIADHTLDRVATMLQAFHRIFLELWRGKMITIAAVHGHCLGGGCELATFCDFVVAAESATFGQPEIKLGCFPPVAMVTFPRLVGMRAALDLILSGRMISAAEAQRIGLVTRVVPDNELDRAVSLLVDDLCKLSPSVLALARRALWSSDGFDFARSLQSIEDFYMRELMKTHDANEGIRAFLEKREPSWQM